MATTAKARQSRALKRRRIIERPRLFALLDESTARVRTLVAAAGYGKTTLAHQWVRRDGRRGVWYQARRSSTDVAALALGVARAAAEIVPDCDARLREHLRAVPNPGEHVDVLAEILGEELADWERGDWLVLDDYQELAVAADAERFVAELVGACPLQVLIASRQRPGWVSGRNILYGEVLELNQTALAMDSREAAEVLTDKSARSAAGLVALANGWPAVISLASVSSAEIAADVEVPDSLYRFFAEEVFDSLSEDVRDGLATLAIAPILDRELAAELLGDESVEAVCSAALDVGILEERDNHLDFHPLARSFLEEWAAHRPGESGEAAAATCLRRFKARRDWDAAFDVITRRGPAGELESLLQEALDELLETARLSTIETWCDFAADADVDQPVFSIARAEVALRCGRHAEAQSFAEAAASSGESALTFRGLAVAGRAAHLASREENGLELFRRAEAAASSEPERRDALWGQLLCAVELELPEAASTLAELSTGVRISDPRDLVRASAHELTFQLRMGCVDLRDADRAWELLPAISDPLIESAFQSVYSSALALTARYDDALHVASALRATAIRYRLGFAIPYAEISAAIAHTGLRRFRLALNCLDDAAISARAARDSYADQLMFAVRLRTLAQYGRVESALLLRSPDIRSALPAIRAEVLGSRALLLASVGRIDEAVDLIDGVRDTSRAVELGVLCPAVLAISALRRGDDDVLTRVDELADAAFRTGAVDLLVAAYRTAPELLQILLKASKRPERFLGLVRQVGDDDLARAVGQSIDVDGTPLGRLSKREREVHDLLCQGLLNRHIAHALYISESTVKVHVHHIFDKLGTRSRTALALQEALRRSSQATSAIGDSDTEPSE
jgi:LuxR family transcriptional regulator, maltose regulon positive regulatory protein